MMTSGTPNYGFLDTLAYKETYDFLTLISPTNQYVLQRLIEGKSHNLDELYSPQQLDKFSTYIEQYDVFRKNLHQEMLDTLISPYDQLKFEALRNILEYVDEHTKPERRQSIPQELMRMYELIFGTANDSWRQLQLTDRRAQNALLTLATKDSRSKWNKLVLSAEQITDDEYSQQDLETFEIIFGLSEPAGPSRPLTYAYNTLFDWFLDYLCQSYPTSKPSEISSREMQQVGSDVLELLYTSILPNLNLTIPESQQYDVVVDPSRKTMVKSEEMKQVILPDITRPFTRMCTLIFHEIGTHLLKSTLLATYSDESKIDGYLDVEEGYCTLIDAYYMNKLQKHYDDIAGQDHVFTAIRADNAIYSFGIALKLSGYSVQDVIEAIRVWWQTNKPEMSEQEIKTKTETAVRRIFRGCVGTDMVFIKDKAYMQGFRAWKKCFELYQTGDKTTQNLIHTICNPATWIAGGFDPFNLNHIKEQNSRKPIFGSIDLTLEQKELHKTLFG